MIVGSKNKKDIVYEKMTFQLSDEMPFLVEENIYESPETETFFDIHYELELGIIIEGEMTRYSEGKSQKLTSGDVWTYGMWDPHGVKITKTPCRLLIIVIWPPFLANMFFPESPEFSLMSLFAGVSKVFHMNDSFKKERKRIAEKFLQANNDSLPTNFLKRRLLLMELLLQVMETTTMDKKQFRSLQYPSNQYSLINPALNLIFSSKKAVSNNEAAKACAISKDKFIKLFQKLMGISFANFARRYRISAAAKMLMNTDLPVKNIAEECDFTDQSHLHRLFLKYYSCTPNEYRKKRK